MKIIVIKSNIESVIIIGAKIILTKQNEKTI